MQFIQPSLKADLTLGLKNTCRITQYENSQIRVEKYNKFDYDVYITYFPCTLPSDKKLIFAVSLVFTLPKPAVTSGLPRLLIRVFRRCSANVVLSQMYDHIVLTISIYTAFLIIAEASIEWVKRA